MQGGSGRTHRTQRIRTQDHSCLHSEASQVWRPVGSGPQGDMAHAQLLFAQLPGGCRSTWLLPPRSLGSMRTPVRIQHTRGWSSHSRSKRGMQPVNLNPKSAAAPRSANHCRTLTADSKMQLEQKKPSASTVERNRISFPLRDIHPALRPTLSRNSYPLST